jgi:hypothetical protein
MGVRCELSASGLKGKRKKEIGKLRCYALWLAGGREYLDRIQSLSSMSSFCPPRVTNKTFHSNMRNCKKKKYKGGREMCESSEEAEQIHQVFVLRNNRKGPSLPFSRKIY